MKNQKIMNRLVASVAVLIFGATSLFAQNPHQLQLDAGQGNISLIKNSNPGGSFLLPPGGGQILTFTPGISPAWLCGGNTNPTSNIVGPISATNFDIQTFGVTRLSFSSAPSASTPLITMANPTPNTQGLRINGSHDAIVGSTLAGSPGVWDMVVDGDAVVSGIFKTGGSLWVDGNNPTHLITANKPLDIRTTTNDSILLATNSINRMIVASNGYVGVNTMNPVSPMHIVATPPDPTFLNGANFLIPDPFNHVMTVENLASNSKGNGIAIVIHNPVGILTPFQANSDGTYNNNETNYMTFYNDIGDHNHIKGRIEGFSYENYTELYNSIQAIGNIFTNVDIYNPLNYFTFNVGYDPNWITFNSNFINFTPPSFPTLTGGSLPSLHFSDITFGDCDIACHTFSYPDGISWGSFPTLTGGSIGSLSFSSPFTLNGSPLTNLDNPFSINWAFIDNIAAPFRDLPYKDKVIMIVTQPVGAVVAFGTSFLGGITYESGSGDYAEWLERADHNEKIAIGDVVSVVGGKISKNTAGATQLMVVSWKPIVLGNMPDPDKAQYSEKVAFLGQVPVKIRGWVNEGDYIIPDGNNNGFAKAIAPSSVKASDLNNILGVAWENSYDAGAKFVKIAVGMKPHEMCKVINDHSEKLQSLDELASEIAPLSVEIESLKASMSKMSTVRHTKKKAKRSTQLSAN